MAYSNVISNDWYHTTEAESIFKELFLSKDNQRHFGILERPHTKYEQITYKLWFVGRSGIGKTCAINRLATNLNFDANYNETSGIRQTFIYWPAKIWDKIILFKLHCLECGYASSKKFSHIVPACRNKADLIVVVFSFNQPNSLQEAQQFLNKRPNDPAHIALGVRFNPYKTMPVKIAEVQELANECQIEVATLEEFGIHNNISEVSRIAPVLNAICQTLWKRDQRFIYMQTNGIQV